MTPQNTTVSQVKIFMSHDCKAAFSETLSIIAIAIIQGKKVSYLSIYFYDTVSPSCRYGLYELLCKMTSVHDSFVT